MDLRRMATGRWQLRWREHGVRRARTFDRQEDAEEFEVTRRRRVQLGRPAIEEDVPFSLLVELYWRDHAVPNLSPATRDVYKHVWAKHLLPRIGNAGVRAFTPRRARELARELQRDREVGAATVRKALGLLGSLLQYAVEEERLEVNVLRGMAKPDYERAREPQIFEPAAVERLRANVGRVLDSGATFTLRDATLISLLAYAGPRPEEALRLRWADIGAAAIRFDGRKTRRPRWTPLLRHLAEDLESHGRHGALEPVFPAHDGGYFQLDDWRNWRRRVWREVAPAGSRPRDLRSSYVTVQVYAGTPLTEIAKHVGASTATLERHYAGIIANAPAERVGVDAQIAVARAAGGRRMDAKPKTSRAG